MQLQPIVYTTDVTATAAWYRKVLGVEPSFRSEVWTAFAIGGATLGIHLVETVPEPGRVELSLIAEESLEVLLARLGAEGISPAEEIREQPFGRSVLLRDPDGSGVQINEHA